MNSGFKRFAFPQSRRIHKKLKEKTDTAAAVSINYGVFINTVLDFTIVAFVIFLLVKQINRLKKEAEVTTQECPKCISNISIKATRCPCCTSEL